MAPALDALALLLHRALACPRTTKAMTGRASRRPSWSENLSRHRANRDGREAQPFGTLRLDVGADLLDVVVLLRPRGHVAASAVSVLTTWLSHVAFAPAMDAYPCTNACLSCSGSALSRKAPVLGTTPATLMPQSTSYGKAESGHSMASTHAAMSAVRQVPRQYGICLPALERHSV
jgi:hypothetical protein